MELLVLLGSVVSLALFIATLVWIKQTADATRLTAELLKIQIGILRQHTGIPKPE